VSTQTQPLPTSDASAKPDTNRFRLREFLRVLDQAGELEICREPIDLVDVAPHLDGNPKAVLFRSVGPEKAELAGNVLGGKRRLALGFGVPERELLAEVIKRARTPVPPCEISTSDAPVHQVVLTGDQADFTRLPVHLQHANDAAPYISASYDIAQSMDKKKRNVGYRRMMLRGRKEAGIDLIAPSDLRILYSAYVQKKERMPIAYVIGSHPADSVAAMFALPLADEVEIMGAMRGAPVPLVRCATIDAMVPADAEVVLEGYLDEQGWREAEGPYGEFLGYYGAIKTNPVFHLTAITMRRDALFQTASISGRHLGRTDTGQLTALKTETAAWASLQTAVREPVAMYCTPSCGGMSNLRVSIRQRYPGEARNAIAAIWASTGDVKHVFVVDDDIDVFSDEQMDWALATRFQADRDLMVASGFRAVPIDPSLSGPFPRTGAKAGFDLTLPFGKANSSEFKRPEAPMLGPPRNLTVRQALAAGPQSFRELMEAIGSRDGRDVLIALEELRSEGLLERAPDGRHKLKDK
jgi:2,5-furandicarboxylate decarboxylase 1